jgi:hypothetical protein
MGRTQPHLALTLREGQWPRERADRSHVTDEPWQVRETRAFYQGLKSPRQPGPGRVLAACIALVVVLSVLTYLGSLIL